MSPIDMVPQWVRDRFDAVEGRVDDMENTVDAHGRKLAVLRRVEGRVDEVENTVKEHGKRLAVLNERWGIWGIFVLQAVQLILAYWNPGGA